MLKLHFKHECVVVELSLLFDWRTTTVSLVDHTDRITSHTLEIALFINCLLDLGDVLKIWVGAVSLLNPVFLVTISTSCKSIFFAPLHFSLDKLEFVRPNAHPLYMLTDF